MKRSFLVITLTFLVSLCLGLLPVYGQESQPKHAHAVKQPNASIPELLISLMDLSKDGKLTGSEYRIFFNKSDLNKDGFITQEEIAKAIEARQQQIKAEQQKKSETNIGWTAPDFSLRTLDGKGTVKLSDSKRRRKPVVLVFASSTSLPFRSQAGALEKLYKQYKSKSEWLLVYIRETPPSDGRQMDVIAEEGVELVQPKTIEKRLEIANSHYANLGVSFPAVVDNMDNKVGKTYEAWPDRLYIVDKKGKIVYKGKLGHKGFNPREMGVRLKKICST